MKPGEFADLVDRMREAQREYFKSRDLDALKRSKSLEHQVDEFLKKRKQGSLL